MTPLLTLAAVHLAALATPGPDILLVSRIAAGQSRAAALWAALGIALAIALWAGAALLGLELLFAQFPWMRRGIQVFGGLYLLWLGFNIWRSSMQPVSADAKAEATAGAEAKVRAKVKAEASKPLAALPRRNWAAFRSGILTNLSNPKVAVFFGSIFSGVLGSGATTGTRWAAFVLVVLLSWAYFSAMAYLLSTRRVQAIYLRMGRTLDRISGSLMLLFGGLLLLDRH